MSVFEIHLPGDGSDDPGNPGTGLSFGVSAGTGVAGVSLSLSLSPFQTTVGISVLGVVGSVSATASGVTGW